MVIGKLQQEAEGHASAPVGSAWAQVEAAQRQVQLPCLLVPQPAHAVLAGEVAAGLTCFGELPAEIKRAIQMHDTGWAPSDAQQIQRLRSGGPHVAEAAPFPSLPSAREKRRRRGRPPLTRSKAFPAWVRSSSAVTSVCSPRMTWRTISVLSRRRNYASINSNALRRRTIWTAGQPPLASATWCRSSCLARPAGKQSFRWPIHPHPRQERLPG